MSVYFTVSIITVFTTSCFRICESPVFDLTARYDSQLQNLSSESNNFREYRPTLVRYTVDDDWADSGVVLLVTMLAVFLWTA